MNPENFKDLIAFLSKYLFKECDALAKLNISNVKALVNILIQANIPFVMTFSQLTQSDAASITIAITVSPTISITKVYQLEEGTLNTS